MKRLIALILALAFTFPIFAKGTRSSSPGRGTGSKASSTHVRICADRAARVVK